MAFEPYREGRFADGTFGGVVGSGPAVVLLHGVGLNRKIWLAQVAALAGQFRVVTYDLMGHGKSPSIAAGASLDDYVGQLGRVMDELQIAAAGVVGFSFGGLIAQKFAVTHPERLVSLVLMSTVYNRTPEECAGVEGRLAKARAKGPRSIIPAAIERWFSPAFIAGQPELIGEIEYGLERNDPTSFLTAYALFCETGDELAGDLTRVTCPVLAMTGELDTGSTSAMVERMVADAPDARAAIIAGGRHMMPVEMPDEVNAVLVPFLQETARGR